MTSVDCESCHGSGSYWVEFPDGNDRDGTYVECRCCEETASDVDGQRLARMQAALIEIRDLPVGMDGLDFTSRARFVAIRALNA